MEQENTENKQDQASSFYRTELRVMQTVFKDPEAFLNNVAQLLERKDAEIEELRIELQSKVYLLNKLDIDHE